MLCSNPLLTFQSRIYSHVEEGGGGEGGGRLECSAPDTVKPVTKDHSD